MDPIRSPHAPRPLLIFTGLSLLAAGVALNAERLGLSSAAPASVTMEQRNGEDQRHHGEEGKMGRASTKPKTGLYAIRGPENAVPQLSRSIDPQTQAKQAGILGVIQQESGHFLASPHGSAFAVGNDDPDVWGGLSGTEVGEAFGVGGLGLARASRADERYGHVELNRFVETSKDPKSTFSVDVDTASYANMRRFLQESGQLPPPDAIRTEELINYFDYDYPQPSGDAPFSVTTEVGPAPWDPSHRLVHVGIAGKVVESADVPPRNLVFLIDVSGSMSGPDRLGLVKTGLASLAAQMNARDRISLVVYAGAAGTVLPPTSGADHRAIIDALQRLESGGSTNGAEGIQLAYALAQASFIEGGINRVLIATDGDFNVGTTDDDALVKLIEAKRESGVFLSVLGVGTGNLNDPMMEQIADAGNGNYAYIDSELEAHKVLIEESGAMLQTIAKDVKLQVEFDASQVAAHRLIGYENRVLAHRDFDDDTKDAGEIGAGHTVTALYEVVPAATASDAPLMTLDLRYKQPDGARSRKLSIPVRDDGRALAESSNDYRFSVAVGMFGQKLRGAEAQADTTYDEIAQLARDALGSDPSGYRHQFVELVGRAGALAGESLDVAAPPCPVSPSEARQAVEASEEDGVERGDAEAPFDWSAFFIEVLRLLPPLLALPVFAMAFWRPRRRASVE